MDKYEFRELFYRGFVDEAMPYVKDIENRINVLENSNCKNCKFIEGSVDTELICRNMKFGSCTFGSKVHLDFGCNQFEQKLKDK